MGMGVQFVKSSFAYPWIYTFQRNKKSIQKSFKTQEEAEKAALAFHKTFGTAQGVSDVKGVYFIKNAMLKRQWEVRVVLKNEIVFDKLYRTKEEAEEKSKIEHEFRDINWRKKQVSENELKQH